MKTRDMCLSAMMAALLCLIGPITVPLGPVPLSLAGFGICLAGGLLGPAGGVSAAAVYILLGAAGLPVFSGFAGGAAHIAGPTGGFIVGYLPCAAISGWNAASRRSPVFPMSAGTAVMYIIGTTWFMLQTGSSFPASVTVCILPFLPGDALKVIAASAVIRHIRRALD